MLGRCSRVLGWPQLQSAEKKELDVDGKCDSGGFGGHGPGDLCG